ncbi:hypothetical protein HXX76_013629 [Chlamydomonas incerta]|uniref:Uncharacterized protein n=1 Tax=Chlamydomonas incerta TaxID=51695 RepID=A0A835STH4_CHLIN|nr:hypothetical protein HXX76_013629 [Chlamydomonas incerta]|eukprot:KAG2425586.1 hypothetical protein HXX76_013629 [Chlamydomonas incerta]
MGPGAGFSPRPRRAGTVVPRAIAPPSMAQSGAGSRLGDDCEAVMQSLRDVDNLRNCLGKELLPEEVASLTKCLESAHLGVDSCLVDGLPALRHHLMRYLAEAASSQTDDLELVEGAMLLVEQLALALGDDGNSSGSSGTDPRRGFRGRQWQTLVTSGGGFFGGGRLQYVPVIELFEVSEDGSRFRMETKAGPLFTVASGAVTWAEGRPMEQLRYSVSDLRAELMNWLSLRLPSPGSDNELVVFACEPSATAAVCDLKPPSEDTPSGIALARSPHGGLQLMSRPV